MFELDNVKNKAILRDVFIFQNWQNQKRSNSAKLPHFLNLTTSKTKQLCETSSFFKLDNVKNEAILPEFFIFETWQHQKRSNSAKLPSKMESCMHRWWPRTNAFCDFFQSTCLNYCACHEKVMPGHTKCCTCHENHLSKPEDLMLQMQPFSGNQRPDLLTALMKMSLVLRLPRKMHPCRSCSKVPRLPSFLEMLQKTLMFCSLLTRSTIPCACHAKPHLNVQKWSESLVFLTFWLRNVLRATTVYTFSTSQLPKVVRTWCVLYILTSICASRHNGVHFFDILTSKSGPELVCFVHFDFEMCFAPQQRALFRRVNFQKWSEREVFLAFSLANVLRATTVCTFSTSQLPKVVRSWGVLCILPWKCASRHNGVQFFISHLARWLRTRRFSEPTFRPSGATNHWNNTVFRDFPTFSRICVFFLLTLSLLWSSLFDSSLLSDSSHHCFSSAHIVGSLTSKLPSIVLYYIIIYHIILYFLIILYCMIWYYIILYDIIWYDIILYCIVLYYIIVYYIIL